MRRRNYRIIFILILIFMLFSSACSTNKTETTESIPTEEVYSETSVVNEESNETINETDVTIENTDDAIDETIAESNEATDDAIIDTDDAIIDTDEVIAEPSDATEDSSDSIEGSGTASSILQSPIDSLPSDEDLVLVSDYIPSIYIDLKYATEDNFTETVIYDFSEAYLRYGTVKKLAAVQDELLAQGYSLKIWDAYRPVSAQFILWNVYPDSNYVANPNTGSSSHSRGSAVDVTIVYSDGSELLMPTGFDDFSSLADRDYSDISDEAADNALVLENAMTNNGFIGYSKEWWHYSDSIVYAVITE